MKFHKYPQEEPEGNLYNKNNFLCKVLYSVKDEKERKVVHECELYSIGHWEEIESYKKEQIRRELLEEIGDVMEEIICQDYIPEHLQINELKTILSILKNEHQE